MLTHFLRLTLLSMLLATSWSAELLSPGFHGPFKTGPLHASYTVLVPTAVKAGKPIPIVFIAGYGNLPKIKEWQAWSEKEGVAVAGMLDRYGDAVDAIFGEFVESYIKSLESKIKLHPFLRFTVNYNRSALFAITMSRFPFSGIAGTVGFNPRWQNELKYNHSFDNQKPSTFHLFVFDEATEYLNEIEYAFGQLARENNATLSCERMTEIGQKDVALAVQQRWVQFVMDRAMSSHSLLSDEERELGKKRLSDRITEQENNKQVNDRLHMCRLLLTIPAMNNSHPDYKRVAELYATSLIDENNGLEDIGQYVLMSRLDKAFTKELTKATEKSFSTEMKRLLKLEGVRAELNAAKMFSEIDANYAKAKNNRVLLRQLVEMTEQLVKTYPATEAGRMGAGALTFLRTELRKLE